MIYLLAIGGGLFALLLSLAYLAIGEMPVALVTSLALALPVASFAAPPSAGGQYR